MLHPEAHCKSLGLHRNLLFIQHRKSIPGTMADCQYKLLTGKTFPAANHNAFHTPFGDTNLCNLAFKTNLPAKSDNFFPHPSYHIAQHIRSNMRFRLVADIFLCTKLHKSFQDNAISAILIFDQGVQLAVRKSACAAFSKLYIGDRVQSAALPEQLHIPLSVLHTFPPLQQNRLIAM